MFDTIQVTNIVVNFFSLYHHCTVQQRRHLADTKPGEDLIYVNSASLKFVRNTMREKEYSTKAIKTEYKV